MNPTFQQIFIEDSVQNHPFCAEVLKAQVESQGFLPQVTVIADNDTESVDRAVKVLQTRKGLASHYEASKKTLVLQKSRGDLFRPCPGTFGEVCCNLYVFNFISGCPFDCSYCYLNSYLNQNGLRIKVDLDQSLDQLVHHFRSQPKRRFRFGTGELADSLAIPGADPLNRYLIERVINEPNATLELKTKSDRVDSLLKVDPRGKVSISWSLSPHALAKREEGGTAPTFKRIQAAKKVIRAGYQVAFHLDPLLYAHDSFESWQKDYDELLEMIFSEVSAKNISWISLGGLRLLKGLHETMKIRFPKSILTHQEMVPGIDQKLRYPKPLRKAMFSYLSERIQARTKQKSPPVYLCMEPIEVWQKGVGGMPRQNENLTPLFSHAV